MIARMHLKGFKSFLRAEANLGPLTLIVGTNASGKSNIREALRVVHGIGLGYPIADVLGEKYGPGGILQWRGIRGGAKEAAFENGGSFAIKVALRAPGNSSHKDQLLTYGVRVDVSNLKSGPRIVQDAPYQGRDRLANEAARNYARIRALCDEDVGRLEQRIGEALEESR